jgi:Fe-S cluster assembly protein SufD
MKEQELSTDLAQYHQSLKGDSELHTLMQQALSNLQHSGLPTKKIEAWKYTSINDRLLASSKIEKLTGKMSNVALKEIPNDCVHFVFVNGKLSKLLSKHLKQLKFCHLNPTSDAHYIPQGSVKFYADENFIDQLNLASLREGVQLEIVDNSFADKPIVISHLFTTESLNNLVSTRFSITVKANCKVAILEQFQYKGLQESPFTLNNVTELTLQENAQVEYVQMQNTTTPTLHLNRIKAKQYRDSKLNMINMTYGGDLSRNELDIKLQEPGATALLNGVYALTGSQHSDQYIEVKHNAPHTYSHQLYKGVLDNQSRGVFTGRVHVAKNSLYVNSTQTNKNLLLGEKAKVDTRPQLEIYADDVKCTHGATIGQLDDEQVFYLETRGINRTQAKEMVARGFGEEVLYKIENSIIFNTVQKLL